MTRKKNSSDCSRKGRNGMEPVEKGNQQRNKSIVYHIDVQGFCSCCLYFHPVILES